MKSSINYFGIEIKERSYKKVFAENLKNIRKKKGLTQSEVSILLDITRSAYANYEQGRREPCLFDLLKLILIFNIDANELLLMNKRS